MRPLGLSDKKAYVNLRAGSAAPRPAICADGAVSAIPIACINLQSRADHKMLWVWLSDSCHSHEYRPPGHPTPSLPFFCRVVEFLV